MRQALLRVLGRRMRAGAAPERQLRRHNALALHHRQPRWSQLNRCQLHTSASSHTPAAVAAVAAVSDVSDVSVVASDTNSATTTANAVAQLEACIAQRRPGQALAYFQQLDVPPSTLVLQKLAILLAKQKNADHVTRAYEILQSVYRLTGLVPDDYTQLASIHVVDACLRYRMLDRAVETYEEAFNQGVFLDLPAYDALLQALVDADRTEEAVAILHEIADENDVSPPERSYFPMLMAFVEQGEYENATALLEKGQGRGVTFTTETFHPLVERAEKDDEPSDALVVFLSYIEDIWEDAKLFDELADLDEDEDDDDDDDEYHGSDDRGDNERD